MPKAKDVLGQEGELKQDVLQIRIEIENVSKTKKYEYLHPRTDYRTVFEAVLTDEFSNTYHYFPGNGEKGVTIDGVTAFVVLNPGDVPVSDLLVFQLPVKPATTLNLSIEPHIEPMLNGANRKFSFRIPASAWRK